MKNRAPVILAVTVACIGLICLLIYRLGSLNGGLSSTEIGQVSAPLGWHGLYHNPLDLPLNALRSLLFFFSTSRSPFIVRLPNVLFGFLSVISLSALVYLWHGRRTALLTALLFATSAWTLHVSRLASSDVMYLWGLSSLMLAHMLVYKYEDSQLCWYLNLLIWGLLLTIPGFVWLVLVDIFWQRDVIKDGWQTFNKRWQRALSIVLPLLFTPLIGIDLARAGQLKSWLGLPAHLATPLHLLKQLVAVFVHLFIRGPEYPTLWLGKAPLLDGFSLALCIIGIYFYARHFKSTRARLLASLFLVSVVLVGLNGPVSFSVIVVLAYLLAAAGLGYLLHAWLKVFPSNPLARSVGVGLITLAVLFATVYNLRAYFIAWPNNPTTRSSFNAQL